MLKRFAFLLASMTFFVACSSVPEKPDCTTDESPTAGYCRSPQSTPRSLPGHLQGRP